MKVIFMGTPEFAVVSLKKLLSEQINIIAVVTAPDKQKGRGLKIQPSPVKVEAIQYNIPVLQPEHLKDEIFIKQLKVLAPDLIVVVAFRILPEIVFNMPPLGTINLHGSLLPKYRGAAPINWAIINGEKETGVTTFFILKKVDTGNIIEKRKIPIGDNTTAGELYDQMAIIGADVLLNTCRLIESGSVKTIVQNKNDKSLAPKIFRQDSKINFNLQAIQIHNFIRGLTPYPAAHTFLNSKMVKLFNSFVVDENTDFKTGSIIRISNNNLIIQCTLGCIGIREIQLEGKKKMPIEDFLRGHAVTTGTVLG